MSTKVRRLFVKNTASVIGLAQTIEAEIERNGSIVVTAVGAGAINQAIKGCAKARMSANKLGREYAVFPAFEDGRGEGQGDKISRIALRVEKIERQVAA